MKKIILALAVFGLLACGGPAKNQVDASSAVADLNSKTFQDFHLVIPQLGIEAPIIADIDGAEKEKYFKALENGVAHLKGSTKPGEGSNIFIFGHSSFYRDQPGNYKEIFLHLEDLKPGDEIIIWYKLQEYKYIVNETKIVAPEQVDVTYQTATEQVTLMTCVPPGTTEKRLIVIAKPS